MSQQPPQPYEPNQSGYAYHQVPQAQPYAAYGNSYPGMTPMPMQYQQKSALAAGLLGIFLGGLGVHNFYLGRTSLGLVQLLISLLSFGVLAGVSAIWGLVEGILYLVGSSPRWQVDGRGVPLSR